MQRSSLVISLVLALILPGTKMSGQLDIGYDTARYVTYLQSVKQFGEFVDRFNQDSYVIPDLDGDKNRTLNRKESILMLFFRLDPRFDMNSQAYSEEYVEKVLLFVDGVVNNEVYVDKHSEQIRAIATIRINYDGRPDSVEIALIQEVDEPNLVRWVISSVEGEFLEIPERDSSQLRFLSPVSHELGFMDLKKALSESNAVIDYTSKVFKYDRLSVFLHGLMEGSIEVNEIISVEWEISIMNNFVLRIGERMIGKSLIGLVIYDLVTH